MLRPTGYAWRRLAEQSVSGGPRRPTNFSRNVPQAASGTEQVSSSISEVQHGASETGFGPGRAPIAVDASL